MTKKTLTAAAIAVAATFLSACSGDDASESTVAPPQGTSSPTEAVSDRGALLRVTSTVGNRTFDPHRMNTCGGEFWTLELVYARLINQRPDFGLEPMLATSWDFVDEGSALVLELRDDVSFRDGSPFDAAAVKANLDRARTLETSTIKNDVASIETVEVVGDHTVRINLVEGLGYDLPYSLAACAGMIINPASFDKPDLDQTGDGLGPYVVKPGSFQVGEASALTADGEWWGDPAIGAHYDEVQARSVLDDTTKLNLLSTGEVDVIDINAPAFPDAEALVDRGGFEFHRVESTLNIALALNLESPVLQDTKLRQAMNLAIDRAGIAQAIMGDACAASVQPAVVDQLGHDPSLEDEWAYDPERAAELLSESGYDGAEITAVQHLSPPYDAVNVAIAAQLQEVGINFVLTSPQSGTEAVPRFLGGDGDAFGFTLGSSRYPAQGIHEFAVGRYTRGVTTDAVETAHADLMDPKLSDDQREERAMATNRAIVEEATMLTICYPERATLASDSVANSDQTLYVRTGTINVQYMQPAG